MPASSIRTREPFVSSTTFPPGPKKQVIGGSLLAFRKDMVGFLERAARDHGDVAYFMLGPQPVYLLSHPDDIKDVFITHNRSFVKGRGLQRAKRLLGEGLLTSEGEFHTRQRRLAQPAFHRQRIASYAATMVECAAVARDRWHDGATLDISAEMMRLTLAVVGKTLFGADVESEADDIGRALSEVMALFEIATLPFAELLEKLPLPATRRFNRARARLDRTVLRLIAERRASGQDTGDLLSMLLLAQDEEGDGGGMTDEQLRDECMTLLLAGHETTSNALTWTWYLLSQHPEVEAKLHDEIDSALGGRVPTFEDLRRLPYTERVLAESMRLYSPAWVVGRRAIVDVPIAGYVVPANSIVLVSQYVVHRDPRWFEDPLRFDPDRWTPEAKAALPRFAYFPFGGGARQCIGEQFAWTEGILLLATLAQMWRARLVAGHPVALQPLITLRPKHGMRMTLSRR
jgi:cytochrome P450